MKKRHPIQISDDLWNKLWDIARKRKIPTNPAQIVRAVLTAFVKKKRNS